MTETQDVKKPSGPIWGPWGTAVVQLLIIFISFWVTWWIFADPKGLLKLYPQPSICTLFWVIIMVVWLAFNSGMHWFADVPQPMKGIIYTVISVIGGAVLVWVMVVGFGGWSPTFSYLRPGNAGYAATGLIILFGFFCWPTVLINWGGWPWTDMGVKQPALGFAQFCVGAVMTLILYCILVLPPIGLWPTPDFMTLRPPLMGLFTAIGWFYCVLAASFLCANLWENWPWSMFKERWMVAMSSLFGMFILGTIIYYILAWWVTLIIPAEVQKIYGDAVMPYQVAVFFVCWVFWIVFWPNSSIGNWPNHFSRPVNAIVRTVITFILGVIMFLVGTRWMAVAVFNEPAVLGTYGGDTMNYVNWMILMELFYFVYFGSYGTIRK